MMNPKLDLSTVNSGNRPSAAVWQGFNQYDAVSIGRQCSLVGDDFMNTGATTAPYQYVGTASPPFQQGDVDDDYGGVLRAALAATDKAEAYVASGNDVGTIVAIDTSANGGKKIHFEARVRISVINAAGADPSMLVGLGAATTCAANLMTDDSGVLATTTSFVGFRSLSDTEADEIDAVYLTASGSEIVAKEIAGTLVSATWIKLGMVYDPAVGLHPGRQQREAAVGREVANRLQVRVGAEHRAPLRLPREYPVDHRRVFGVPRQFGMRIESSVLRREAQAGADFFAQIEDAFDSGKRLRRHHGVEAEHEAILVCEVPGPTDRLDDARCGPRHAEHRITHRLAGRVQADHHVVHELEVVFHPIQQQPVRAQEQGPEAKLVSPAQDPRDARIHQRFAAGQVESRVVRSNPLQQGNRLVHGKTGLVARRIAVSAPEVAALGEVEVRHQGAEVSRTRSDAPQIPDEVRGQLGIRRTSSHPAAFLPGGPAAGGRNAGS